MQAKARLLLLLAAVLFTGPAVSAPIAIEDVPEPLRPWVDWVLSEHPDARCPTPFDDGGRHRCAWPSRLELDLTGRGGTFVQRWRAFRDLRVVLPGSAARWPREVTVDGAAVVVTARDGRPEIALPAGVHEVGGRFDWSRLPESLALPPASGLVRLRLDGAAVAAPEVDGEGRLWLRRRGPAPGAAAGARDTLDVRVFRRVADTIPLTVTTRLEIRVSGEPREEVLGPVLLGSFAPLGLESPLPARLEPGGGLKLQVRPGRFTITVTGRHPGPIDALTLPPSAAPWPDEEVWVFAPAHHLRLVTLEGVPPVDPRQTRLPPEWRELAAYRVGPGDTLRIVEKRRGDPDPAPDRLGLERRLWLDFDGGGYTIQDRITGELNRSWRLEVEPPLALGRVAVDGEPRFITRREGSRREGVELRRGALDLVADSRYTGGVGALSAPGWDHDFQRLSARLELPPGWRLLAASGMDRVSESWLGRWTLLDLFLVLLVAGAVSRLWSFGWGAVALVTLGLTFHESGAPTQVWLHVLAAVALLRVLPAGRFRRLVGFYRYLALLALVVVGIPFAVDQVRIAFYPQLERPWQGLGAEVASVAAKAPPAPAAVAKSRALADAPTVLRAPVRPGTPAAESAPGRSAGVVRRFDPDARIQTGPGLPRWQWRTVDLAWSGPVERGEPMEFVLVPPGANLVLRLLSVLLLVLLALRVAGIRRQSFGGPGAAARTAAAGLAVCVLAAGTPRDARADIPDQPLLDRLRDRLLAEPDCLPRCAQLPWMRLTVTGSRVEMTLEAHVAMAAGVPLPGRRGQWEPAEVRVDGAPATGLHRDEAGHLWLWLPEGIHRVEVAGDAPARPRFQIDLPLGPRRLEAELTGWTLEGLGPDGVAEGQLELRRRDPGSGPRPALVPGTLPPFVGVTRTLVLGLEWQVVTTVARRSPPGSAIVLEIPLLEGEAVVTPGIRVADGAVRLNMSPGARTAHWQSRLQPRETIELTAPDTGAWVETWRLDASPIWHVDADGIPVVHHQDRGRRLPTWQPWPGESVTLTVTRPAGVDGRTLTIDASILEVAPGRRTTDATLDLRIRSSQGGQHAVTLPEGARLESVRIDGATRPIRLEGRTVTLPLAPGSSRFTLAWRDPARSEFRFATPAVDLGTGSVNGTVRVKVPDGRWVLLTGGPRAGPAVLFWGVLAVVVAVAIALGRLPLTPLRTHHWLLLGLGLTQIPVYLGVVVVGWLFALAGRRRLPEDLGKWRFNLVQVGLALLTAAALGLLFYAIQQGLLGAPEMQISGNASNGSSLRWFADRSGAELPVAWYLSLPVMVYRLLMLAWAVWLTIALIRWLRWAWECYSHGGYWRSLELIGRHRRKTVEPADG